MRMRRHTQPAFGSLRNAPWGRFARDLGLVALTFVVGYAVSVYWITPGSASGDEHAVPRVLGQPLDEARAAITKAGFRSRIEGERPSTVGCHAAAWSGRIRPRGRRSCPTPWCSSRRAAARRRPPYPT